MNLDSLMEDSLKDLGLRFILVGLLPTIVLFLFSLGLFWSGAPGNAPDPNLVIQNASNLGAKEATFLAIAILVVALVLQPLQLSIVRILEGYWGGSWLGDRLIRLGVAIQRRRRRKLADAIRPTDDDVTREEEARMGLAAWQLRGFYPPEHLLLPTRLGNVLRSAEHNAGNRYGLDAVIVWPRIYPLVSDKVAGILADQRDRLDIAVRFCAVFLLASLIGLAVLAQHGWWLAIPAITLVLAWVSYQSAIAAALAYGEGIQTVFDLHRFDLLKALHLPLPPDRSTELEANRQLSDFLRQGLPMNFQYDHGTEEDSYAPSQGIPVDSQDRPATPMDSRAEVGQ